MNTLIISILLFCLVSTATLIFLLEKEITALKVKIFNMRKDGITVINGINRESQLGSESSFGGPGYCAAAETKRKEDCRLALNERVTHRSTLNSRVINHCNGIYYIEATCRWCGHKDMFPGICNESSCHCTNCNKNGIGEIK